MEQTVEITVPAGVRVVVKTEEKDSKAHLIDTAIDREIRTTDSRRVSPGTIKRRLGQFHATLEPDGQTIPTRV